MACSFAILLVSNDESMSRYLDLYTNIQDKLEELDHERLKSFVEKFNDDAEFMAEVAVLDNVIPDLNLRKFYVDGDEDAQEMIVAAVKDFLIMVNLIKLDYEDFGLNF